MAGDPDAGWPWLSRADVDELRRDIRALTAAIRGFTHEVQALVRIIAQQAKKAPEDDPSEAPARVTLQGV